ncbi:glycosyltransferase involved in cell wall biosynthesis [Nonomuraea thailandensis]|uniref:Glycosyltransferase involved in cell wall biosynthesis n=1 Tax=Nonomuraea thailandensis TaxID=1188745 RepID=A0A9X2KAF7_9ACTN|nr:glycosyltransferase [Nonomuraea thailandensis]MCP2362906.1 glycosyltransferase involved in cell wall biosynthesis [Nonomuraea thailandensis]
MRVLYVSPYPPARDGIGAYTQVLARAVRERGHEIAVVAARPDPGAPDEVIGTLGDGGGASMRAAVARFRPDVVHVQFAVPAFGARSLAVARRPAASGVPVVATLHEVTRDTALLRGPGRALYRRLARGCDRLVVHTRAALETVDALGLDAEVTLVPHFSAPPPPATGTAAVLRARFGLGEDRVLLAFGHIHVSKGLDDLVRALATLPPAALGGVRVVVAGAVRRRHGPFRVFEARDHLHEATVRRLARRHGVRDRLVFTGYVPDGDIAAWFAAAEAVVLPYRDAEQSGVANLARAFGVPVIATTVGGLAELFEGSPWAVPPGAPDRLAAAIDDLLTRPAPARDTSAVRTTDTDLDTVAARTIAVYEAVRGPLARTPGNRPDAP